jgi:hypothetical protein
VKTKFINENEMQVKKILNILMKEVVSGKRAIMGGLTVLSRQVQNHPGASR